MGWKAKAIRFALLASILMDVGLFWPRIVAAADAHEGLAAWVQAAGVFLAVFLSGWLANRQRTQEKLEKSLSLVSGLITSVWLLEAELDKAEKFLEAHKQMPNMSGSLIAWFDEARIKIPPELISAGAQMSDCIYEVVGPIQNMATTAQAFNGYLDLYARVDPEQVWDNWQEVYDRISGNLVVAKEMVKKAQALFGHSPGGKS